MSERVGKERQSLRAFRLERSPIRSDKHGNPKLSGCSGWSEVRSDPDEASRIQNNRTSTTCPDLSGDTPSYRWVHLRTTGYAARFTLYVLRFTFYVLPVFWLSGIWSSTIAAKSPLQVIQVNTDSLILKFEVPKLQFSQQEIDGHAFTQITFTRAPLTMEVGRPSQPVFAQLIGIPIDASPHATIINSRIEVRQTGRIIPAQRPTFANQQPTFAIDTDFYRRDHFQPANVVGVVPIGFIREQRVARLQIQPIQYNPARSQIKIYRELLIRIDLNSPSSSSAAPPPFIVTSHPFEQLFQAKLLNYNQAKAWRRYPQNVPAAPAAQRIPEERYKILIDRTGVYKITYSELRRAGANPARIDLETLKMENRGRRVGAYAFDRDTDSRFDRDDSIVFFGQALIGDKFTDDNVYWLSWGGIGGSRVRIKNAAPKTPNAPIPFAFKKTERFEQDRKHDRLLDVKFELADHYFWTSLTGGADGRFSKKDFPIQLPRAVPRGQINQNAKIRMKFQGASRERNARHQARILFNGTPLGRVAEWRRQAAPLVKREFEQNRLIHPEDTDILTIIAEDQNGTPPGKPDFYLDWFEVDYWHTFEALEGRLEFNSETESRSTGTVQYRVTNLHSPNVDVYQIRDGSIFAKLTNGRIERNGGRFQITFEANVIGQFSYFVVERDRHGQVQHILPIKPSMLRNPANQADYIIISHRDFINSIQPLAAFRRSQGLSLMVVDVEEVYDQFNYGIFNPLAIQKFLRYAYTSWRAPKPTYVLLVGDAHYDYKRATVKLYQQEFDRRYNLYPIYVPTFHGWAPASGETAMDHRFVTVSGDDPLPDMFIGRLPVQFPDELDAMVKKIIDYEAKRQTGPWQGQLMQVADNEVDNPTDDIFERSREQLIEEFIPVGYDTRKVYLRQIGSPERTKQAILTTIDDGVLILEYSGHGGTQTWADEGIFRIADAEGLRNRHLPFIITTTCLNGQFDQPLQFEQRSLSEQFLMERGGAIGILSATRLTFGSANAEFDKDLFTSIFTVKPPTLGAIIADAKTQFMMKAPQLWIPGAEQYTLFGDPATRLALPDLGMQVELEEIAVDPNKELVIRPNIVGRHRFSPITGEIEFHKATDFSTGAMSALVFFANDLDDNPTNDHPRRKEHLQVWQGEFGAIRIPIPKDVTPGRGIVRLFAFDDQRAAVGGTKFWTYQPAILEVREDTEHQGTNTLNLFALVVDNEGPAGIKAVEVVWSDTVEFKERTMSMIPDPAPPVPAANGGRWYKLQMPIPLPKSGATVRYQVVVTDRTNHIIKTDRKSLRVPEGANIAIASAAVLTPTIHYAFSSKKKAHTLTAQLINDGGREIDIEIEVWFSDGALDRNRDGQIDPEAKVLGRVLVRADAWKPSKTNLQEAMATLILTEPLSTGFHQIYVFADPESPDDDHEDGVVGRLDEPRSFDNKSFVSLVVNEFTLKANEELTAFSLDRVFDTMFPIGASSERTITLSVNAIEPPVSFQPDLRFGPLPRATALQSGNSFRGAYQIELHADIEQLVEPAALKLRFDFDALKDNLQKNLRLSPGAEGFNDALQREVESLAIYQWKEAISAWKRLPSESLRDHDGNLALERFVTPTQGGNTSVQKLPTSDVRVDPNLTPVGKWVLLFLDADRYEVSIQRKGKSEIEKLDRIGRVDVPFRDERLGVELDIPHLGETDEFGRNLIFEFGDVLAFETNLGPNGDVLLSASRGVNRGDGSAHVRLNIGEQDLFESGDWLIFFQDSQRFELRNGANELIRNTDETPVVGRVNQPLVLNEIGIEVLVTSGARPFEFGDKIKFSTAAVGVVSTKTKDLSTFALMQSTDQDPPKLQLWVDGKVPHVGTSNQDSRNGDGSIIPPRPKISLLLEDENGVDLDSFTLAVSKDEGTFETIKDFKVVSRGQVTAVPIRYKPTLFIGRYRFRISVKDLNGNPLGGEGGFREFRFFVEQQPDLEPPTIEIRINGEVLTDGEIIHEQPQFEILTADESGIDPARVQFAFSPTSHPLLPLPEDSYEFVFDVTQPMEAQITFEPDLPNDEYQLQILATDMSENTAETPISRFCLEEAVDIRDVLNVPNPVRTNTVFTYNLVQAPDWVMIKLYTVSGRLIRTIEDASARRGYNETFWDARDENGMRLANGVYFYKVIVETNEGKIEKIGRLAILR